MSSLEPPQKASYPYKGNPVDGLITLRKESASIIKSNFPAVTLDESGSKSLALSGGSLRRKIDVVSSNWYDTILYVETGQEHYRGVMILDLDTKSRPKNQPFLHNEKIDDRDRTVSSNLRKAIRLMKSVKYDSDKNIKVSSYDIAALAFCMPNDLLNVPVWFELMLVNNCVSHLATVITNDVYRDSLIVPDGSRKIFGTPGTNIGEVSKLFLELNDLKTQIEKDLGYTSRTVDRAAIHY